MPEPKLTRALAAALRNVEAANQAGTERTILTTVCGRNCLSLLVHEAWVAGAPADGGFSSDAIADVVPGSSAVSMCGSSSDRALFLMTSLAICSVSAGMFPGSAGSVVPLARTSQKQCFDIGDIDDVIGQLLEFSGEPLKAGGCDHDAYAMILGCAHWLSQVSIT